MIGKIRPHLRRLRHQAGQRLSLGDNSFRVRGYAANRLATSAEQHEPQLMPLFEALLNDRQGAFVDIGVNVGQTLFKVLSIDPNRQYIGFEPQVSCCFFVEQFLVDNDLGNCQILPIGLSDDTELLSLYAKDGFDEMGSILNPGMSSNRSSPKPISVTTGDIALKELGIDNPSIIKIDVEGAELRVIKGLQNTLHTHRPPLLFEVLPDFVLHGSQPSQEHSKQVAAAASELWKTLSKLEYSVYNIDEAGHLSPVDKFEIHDENRFISFEYAAFPCGQTPPKSLLAKASLHVVP